MNPYYYVIDIYLSLQPRKGIKLLLDIDSEAWALLRREPFDFKL